MWNDKRASIGELRNWVIPELEAKTNQLHNSTIFQITQFFLGPSANLVPRVNASMISK